MHGIDRAVGGRRGGHGPERRAGDAEAAFLAFQGTALLDGQAHQRRVRLVLAVQGHAQADDEEHQHAGQQRAALAQVLDVVAEGEHQRRRDQDDGDHLQQVAPGGRVLERMRRVHAEEAATVGAQLLDGDLAGRRAERDALLGALQGHRVGVVQESLRNALPDEEQRQQQAQRQQAVEGAAGQVDPEVAQAVGAAAADAAGEGHQHAEADGGADEVLHAEADHLAEIAQGGFAAIGLPVGVGDEAHGGVERQAPFQPRQLLRVQRQHALQHEDGEEQHEAREVEGQQSRAVGFPALFALGIDAGEAVAETLHRRENRREEGALPLHYAVVEAPEEGCRRQHQHEEGQDEADVLKLHVAS
ncbi:hypothetical protein D9M69_409660 [compost metagenome]